MRLLYLLTGGRPMRKIESGFVDKVSGKMVSLYQDAYGRRWLCDGGPWSLTRVSR